MDKEDQQICPTRGMLQTPRHKTRVQHFQWSSRKLKRRPQQETTNSLISLKKKIQNSLI